MVLGDSKEEMGSISVMSCFVLPLYALVSETRCVMSEVSHINQLSRRRKVSYDVIKFR